MTETQVKEILKSYGLLNLYKINTADFTSRLNQGEVDLENYINYFISEIGARENIASADSIEKYTEARTREEQTLLQHIYNAYLTFQKLNSNLKDPKLADDILKEMIEPHLLYFMFSAAELPLEASKYRHEALKYYRMYSSAVNKLPEDFDYCKEDLSGNST